MFCFFFAVEKATLEKRVKELEESLASKDTEAEKVAKDAAAREAEFVNRVAFLTQNVRGKTSICSVRYLTVHRTMLTFAPLYNFVQRQRVSHLLLICRVIGCRSTPRSGAPRPQQPVAALATISVASASSNATTPQPTAGEAWYSHQ